MSLLLTEEQESIQRAARAFVQAKLPTSHLRALRDGRDPIGLSRDVWREMGQLGLAGITIPPAFGGAGLGFAELGSVLEECGRCLAPTPLVSSVVLGASALTLGGTSEQQAAHLPGVAAGERILALAHEETTRHARYAVATRAERVARGWRVSGEKTMVLDGHIAGSTALHRRATDSCSSPSGAQRTVCRSSGSRSSTAATRRAFGSTAWP